LKEWKRHRGCSSSTSSENLKQNEISRNVNQKVI
jgi:hypothetical protein